MSDHQTPANGDDADLAFSRILNFNQESVSPETLRRSRKNNAVFLQFIKSATAATIAEQMGVHESTLSRFQNGPLGFACLALACAGLKVVPEDAIVYIQSDDFK